MEFDFGGYVTKNDTLCADGRTIRKNAFKAQDGQRVPLVWMHQRNEPENVLGHAILENRDDGVYGYCKFNNSPRGKQAKLLVEHGDITSMSIYANNLVQKGGNVTHGMIREVSLVIAPANPGALIDNPVVQHGDEEYEDLTRATITSGCDIELNVEYEIEHSEDDDSEPVKMEAKKKKAPSKSKPDPDDEDDEDDEDEEDDEEEDDFDDEEEDDDMDSKKRKSMQHADDDSNPPKTKKAPSEASNDDEETVQDVYDSMTDKQKKVVAYMIGAALAEQEDDEAEQSDDMEGDDFMARNVFDQNNEMEMSDNKTPSLTHDQISCIFEDAKKCGSLRESFMEHAQEYGIENIDILFPDAKTVGDNPYLIKRKTEWVAGVLNETNHVPFSRIKTVQADITADEARAKGYVKGNMKKEEVIKLLKRVTTPTTVYKKQKLDRDDILDITDLNIVAWLKSEMRVMLDEELARAFLISDGREIDDPDKIDEEHIRPIWKDDDMYAYHIVLPADITDDELPEELLKAQEEYNGSGNPKFYTTSKTVLKMLLLKDKIGRRLYNTETELSSAIGVASMIKVPVMERQTRVVEGKTLELVGIIVNLIDYTVGATAGGQVSMFDDFDIDYNQFKYLMETRCCGALTVPKSAIVIEKEVVTGP